MRRAIVKTLNDSDPTAPARRPASAFITHLVYLTDGAVRVDEVVINELGIQCIGLQSKQQDKSGVGRFDKDVVGKVLRQI